MSNLVLIFAISLTALNLFLFSIGLYLRVRPLTVGQKGTFKEIKGRVRVFRFFSFLGFWHGSPLKKFFLVLVMLYTFLLFNPRLSLSTGNDETEVNCPDGFAYRLLKGEGDGYLPCENFNEYFLDLHKGVQRKDLLLNYNAGAQNE